MDPLDRDAVILALTDNLAELGRRLEALPTGVPEPAVTANRWTPCQVMEHLVTVEEGVQRLLDSLQAAPPSGKNSRDKDPVVIGLATLPQRIVTPAPFEPCGRFASATDGLAALRTLRERTIDYARTIPAPWDSRHWPHPILGDLDIGQWLLLVATHGDRHARQIGGD